MILRKPYAFFIKYFRVINLIMAILMAILIYRTFTIGHFLSEYISDYAVASNGFVLGNYINFYHFLLALLVVILTIVVTSVMFVKEKPKKLYIFNLILYVLLIVLYAVDSTIMRQIYDRILDIRVSIVLRDVTYITLGVQIVSIFMTLIRATGFDLKQFDFGRDLEELEIDVKDNEEFEVAVEVDRNKMKRDLRSKIREFGYFYAEHKFIIKVISIILIVIIAFIIFIFKSMYSANYKESEIFSASRLGFNIKNSYITNTDQVGKVITAEDKVLVVVRIDVHKYFEDEREYLNTGLINLRIGNDSYGQTTKYNGYLTDIGVPYVDQELELDFADYILTFEIPKSDYQKNMTLKINDNVSYIRGEIGAKNMFVKLKPMNLMTKEKVDEKKIGDDISFSGSILGDSVLSIQSYEVGNKFKAEYQFCFKKDKCVTSYEYVTPTATGNYFKTLLKINGEFEEDESVNLDNINDIYYFLNEFGTINYVIDGNSYSHKINSKHIKPKVSKDGMTYIEVNKDVEKATSIDLTFNVRNYTYKYILK